MDGHVSLGIVFGITVLFLATPAHADSETVRLADGSVYAGELVEKVPSDHVTIKLATGEVRRFEWATLAGTTQPVPPVQPLTSIAQSRLALATFAPTTPPPPAHIEVTSDSPGALLMKVANVPYTNTNPNTGTVYTGSTERTFPVCYAPCSADIDPTAAYFVTGAYVTETRRFAIPAGDSKLVIHSGSSVVSAVGGWTLAVGVMSGIFGTIATPVAFINATGPWNGWQYLGVTTLIAGAALMLVGIPFIVAGLTHASVGNIQVARKPRFNGAGFTF
jgi:hypothetical protein